MVRKEGPPPVPPEDMPDSERDQAGAAGEASPHIPDPVPARPELRGEQVDAPSVPLGEGFDPSRVKKVVRLEPDYSDRDAIREEEREAAAGRRVPTRLADTRQGASPATTGRKGKTVRPAD